MTRMYDKLIIRNAILKIEDIFGISGLLVLVYFAIIEKTIVWLSIILGLLIFFFYIFLKRLNNRKPQIIIDKRGIEFPQDMEFYGWDDIKFAFIRVQVKGYGKYSEVIENFHVVTQKTELKKRINDLKYSPKLVKETIDYYSGRKIGDYKDKFRHEINQIVKGKNTLEISNIFSEYYRKMVLFNFLLFFGAIGLSIYLQFKTSFPYFFGIGFIVIIMLLFLLNSIFESRLRNNRLLIKLTNKQFNSLAIQYNIKYPKKQLINYIVILGIFAVIIFIISYISTI